MTHTKDEFDIRGMLASKLTCWHRLRETEENELVALVAGLTQPAPVQEPLSFNCSAGCGSCGVKLQDFVTHQTQAQEGDEWVVVATEPQVVSTCCGSPVEVWDERKQDITASVDATPPAAPVQDLPFGVGGGLVAIKTLLSRDPCVHANTAIEMIDAILSAPAAQRQWVGLTDEERDAIFELHHTRLGGWDHGGDEVMYDKHFEDAVAAIETKLKEKNT